MIKTLMKTKKFYEQPLTVVTQVELESPICSGSAEIVNTGDPHVAIQDQEVNTSFDYNFSYDSSTLTSGWDDISK